MSKSNTVVITIAGWLCIVFAVVMVFFSVLMYILEVPLNMCVGIGATSLFPLVIAVACLMPSKRTLALRAVGAVICTMCVVGLIASFVSPPPEKVARSPRRGPFVALAIAGAAMMFKGKWPGSDEAKSQPEEANPN